MFFRNNVKSVQEQQYQQLSELSSVFASYRQSFHTLIPVTTVSSMVAKLDTILRSNHPQTKVSVLFESLNYEALFTSESACAQSKIARFLRVHQKLKVSVDSEKSRMSFLYLLDTAKKAMEDRTLERDIAEDIRFIIDEHRELFNSKPGIIRSYGSNSETHPIQEEPTFAENEHSQASMPTNPQGNIPRRPMPRSTISTVSSVLFMGALGGAFLEGIVAAVTTPETVSLRPGLSGYSTLN